MQILHIFETSRNYKPSQGNIEGEASVSHLVGKVEDDSMETIQWECLTCAHRHVGAGLSCSLLSRSYTKCLKNVQTG